MSFEHFTTITRAPHDGENPYAQISRALIRDEAASPLLRFMLIFLLSQKDGWKIKPAHLIKLMKPHGIGKDKVYSLFNEGIELGYIERHEWLEKGLKRTSYCISESPIFKKSLPRPAQPEAEFKKSLPCPAQPDAAEPTLKKEHRISKDILKKKEEPSAPARKYMEFTRYPNITKMTFEGYDRLVKKYGAKKVEENLQALNVYAEYKRKKFNEYSNHEATIRVWIERDRKNKKPVSSAKIIDIEKEEILNQERRKKWREMNASKDS